MKTLYKVFKKDLESNHGNIKWEVGKWQKHKGKLEMCYSGFHASENVVDAMSYTSAEEIALVEVKGKHLVQDDKQVWESMRIVKVSDWKKEDSVSLAIFAAELCIKNFEKECPDDKRPRNAIKAAKKWLKNPTEKNQSAAWSAWSAAWSAARSAAGSAAESAAWSARSAAGSAARSAAWSAARSVAWSAAESVARSAAESAARSAAWSAARSAAGSAAESAAWSAARKTVKQQCRDFVINRLKEEGL